MGGFLLIPMVLLITTQEILYLLVMAQVQFLTEMSFRLEILDLKLAAARLVMPDEIYIIILISHLMIQNYIRYLQE